jgi:hypothetical protein
MFNFCHLCATPDNVHPLFPLYCDSYYMFQSNWPFSGVQVVCLRELLFCFSIVIPSGSFFYVGNMVLPCMCSVCGFAGLLITIWFGVCGSLRCDRQVSSMCFSSYSYTPNQRKSTNQQNHELNKCMATAHYNIKKRNYNRKAKQKFPDDNQLGRNI